MFTERDECYYVPFRDIERFYNRAQSGGRKSFTYEEVDKTFMVKNSQGVMLHYLEGLQQDLLLRK